MSDRWIVALAACAWLGAALAHPVPLVVAAFVVAAAAVARHPVPTCAALALLCSLLADRALSGLDAPADAPIDAVVTLATDAEPTLGGGVRFEAVSPHGRLLAEARAPTASDVLRPLLAGDRARVVGRTVPFARQTAWTRSRHLAGRLRVESVTAVGPGAPTAVAANRFRRLLHEGAASLPDGQRALLAGLVLGDDRAQPPELTADFRAAGLTHLLAVSGQNVLLLLTMMGPLLHRLRLWPRYLASTAVVGAFALVTRFEPSVVRAAFVAGVALFARTTGRPSGGVRHLCIAVCLLLVVDPLLVHSLGFRLSVAASTGVLALAPPIVEHLPGPRWFRDGLGVTTGAQLAVAPVLIPTLGPMPLAALPANVVAGPLAAALMAWGLTAGTVAGLVGGRVAGLLHRATGVGLASLEHIAALGASLPAGRFDLRHLTLVAAAAALGQLAARREARWPVPLAWALAAAAVVGPITTPVVAGARPAGEGATVWVDGPVAVVDVGSRADPVEVLQALRDARVAAVGVVVLRSGRQQAVAVLDAVEARFPVGSVLVPPGVRQPGAVVPPRGFRARVGRLRVVVDRVGPPMHARVGWVGAEQAQGRLPQRR